MPTFWIQALFIAYLVSSTDAAATARRFLKAHGDEIGKGMAGMGMAKGGNMMMMMGGGGGMMGVKKGKFIWVLFLLSAG
jgi:hypothetical protein